MSKKRNVATEYQNEILRDLYRLIHEAPVESRVWPLALKRTVSDKQNLNKYLVDWFSKHPSVEGKYDKHDDEFLPARNDYSRLRSYFEGGDDALTARLLNPDVIEAFREFIEGNHDTKREFHKKYKALANRETLRETELKSGFASAPLKSKPALNQMAATKVKNRAFASQSAESSRRMRSLTNNMQSFEDFCTKYLIFPPFSSGALSIHLTFAAFYSFLAITLMWAFFGISQFGSVDMLPDTNSIRALNDPNVAVDIEGLVNERYFILAVVAVVVLIFVLGALISTTKPGSIVDTSKLSGLERSKTGFALGVAAASGGALYLSGMHYAFAILFAVMMMISLLIASKAKKDSIVWLMYPFAFCANIVLLVLLGLGLGSINGAGGVLPVLSLLCLIIGYFSRTKTTALVVAGFVILACSLVLALLNYFVFDGKWFLIEPWEPGTMIAFVLIPMANGIWDFISVSTTRSLSKRAVNAVKDGDQGSEYRYYLIFVLLDIISAFAIIIMLYMTLHVAFDLYNAVSGQNANLEAYFRGFQSSLTSSHSLFVTIMLVTVLLPTVLHVHLVARSSIHGKDIRSLAAALVYVAAIGFSLFILLSAARGILSILYPAVPS
ncbi:MAG: hypothetical protein AB8B47_13265 [Roseobacter sp.]